MKKLLYTFTLIAIISSCRSIEKMVERGDYDGAIIHAAEKLAGKKNKKTKHVQALEEAFLKITQRDLDKIAYLDGTHKPKNWERIEAITDQMARRQDKIEPLLPLISNEGYVAQFDFVDTYALKNKARAGAAAYYYELGVAELEQARAKEDKWLARSAHENFARADHKLSNYKNTARLLHESHELGTAHIMIEVKNVGGAYVPARLQTELEAIDPSRLNSKWRRYYSARPESATYDYRSVLELTDIDLGPEREIITHHTDTKEVKDGFRYLRDKKGNIKTDSTGKKLKEDKFKTVYADVTEVHREKAAMVRGLMKVYHYNTAATISTRPLSVEALFSDYASTYRGDRRALCDTDHSRLKTYPLPFPHDEDMIADATYKLKDSFVAELSQIRI